MKKSSIFGTLAITFFAALLFVACGPSDREQIVGSYSYEDEWEDPVDDDSNFTCHVIQKEVDTYGDDGSYTETGTHTAIYEYHNADNERLTSFTFVFTYKRTGTWELKYEDGMDILSQTGKSKEWDLESYEAEDPDNNDIADAMAEELLSRVQNEMDQNWIGKEQRYHFINVDEDKLTLESASEVLRLPRIKE